jgi:hypothetical protein
MRSNPVKSTAHLIEMTHFSVPPFLADHFAIVSAQNSEESPERITGKHKFEPG